MFKKIISVFILFNFLSSFVFSNTVNLINAKLDEQDNLLDSLEFEMQNMKLIILSLQDDKTNMTNHISSLERRIKVCKEKIKKMQSTIDSMRTALLSNKEDTHEVIEVLGQMQEELDKYKKYVSDLEKRLSRTNIIVQTMIPCLTLPMIGTGAYLYFSDEKDIGKMCMVGGCCLFIGAELAWNGGKFIFKLW